MMPQPTTNDRPVQSNGHKNNNQPETETETNIKTNNDLPHFPYNSHCPWSQSSDQLKVVSQFFLKIVSTKCNYDLQETGNRKQQTHTRRQLCAYNFSIWPKGTKK